MQESSLDSLLAELGGERRLNYAPDSLIQLKSALSELGNPEKGVYTLVVGGTNGKGTVSLLLSAALMEAGFRVGTYLSPHLQHPRERFLHSLTPIDEQELENVARAHAEVARKFDLTYFEFLTILMFVWAKQKGCDFLVLEVGLGGRLDATNVTDPVAVAITNISFDHMQLLGNTLPRILEEKLGILRPEGLLFTGITDPALLDQVEKRCLELDAIYYFSKEIRTERKDCSWAGQSITLNGIPFELSNPSEGTARNAALAFLMLRIVFPSIPIETIQRAFRRVVNPGRLEVVSESPRVVLSGDHNPAGVEDLLTTLERLKAGRTETGKLSILCGFSPDKPYREMYGRLRTIADEILLAPIASRKSELPSDYASLGEFRPDARKAAEELVHRSSPGDTVLVTGSLYLVGEVRSLWRSSPRYLRDER